jgi:hypothetical protein
MTVIDHEPRAWFLLREGAALYLDVNCRSTRAGYSVLIKLNADEAASVGGATPRDALAALVEQAASGQFAARDCSAALGDAVLDAVAHWRYGTPHPKRSTKP